MKRTLLSDVEEATSAIVSRAPRALPTMTLNPEVSSLLDFRFEDFTLSGYDPHPHIAAAVAV